MLRFTSRHSPARHPLAFALRATLPGVAAVTAVAGGLLACAVGAAADGGIDGRSVRLLPDDLGVVARGEAVYAEHCASCHGANLEGQDDWRRRDARGLLPAPPHDASGHTWHHADDLLFEIVKYGPGAVIGDASYPSAMPAHDGVLDDEAIVAALSYIVNAWPEEERAYQAEIDAAQSGSPRPGAKDTPIERLFK